MLIAWSALSPKTQALNGVDIMTVNRPTSFLPRTSRRSGRSTQGFHSEIADSMTTTSSKYVPCGHRLMEALS